MLLEPFRFSTRVRYHEPELHRGCGEDFCDVQKYLAIRLPQYPRDAFTQSLEDALPLLDGTALPNQAKEENCLIVDFASYVLSSFLVLPEANMNERLRSS